MQKELGRYLLSVFLEKRKIDRHFKKISTLDSLKYDYDRLHVDKGYLSTKIIGLQKYN